MSEYYHCPKCGATLKAVASTGPTDRRKTLNWASVDWAQPNVAIARKLQTTADYVSYKRARHAPGTLRAVRYYDWSNVDWAKSNRTIARLLGASENYVSVVRHRKKHGAL